MSLTTIDELMTRVVVSVTPDQSAREAEIAMTQDAVRHLAVVDEDETLVGILSSHDLLQAEDHTPVSELMSQNPKTVQPDTPAYEAVVKMLQHGFHSLPVVDESGRLVGIVTATDVMLIAYDALRREHPDEPGKHTNRISVEHAALRAKLERVRNARRPSTAALALGELDAFLGSYYQREEAPEGPWAQLVAQTPSLGPKLTELRQEHARIRERLAGLLDETRQRDDAASDEVSDSLKKLIEMIEQQEAREAAIIEELAGAD